MSIFIHLAVLFLHLLDGSRAAPTSSDTNTPSSNQIVLAPSDSNLTIRYTNRCQDPNRSAVIQQTFLELGSLAAEVSDRLALGLYANAFIPPSRLVMLDDYKVLYNRISQDIPTTNIYTTCNQDAECASEAGTYAHTNPETNTINFCNFFFVVSKFCSAITKECAVPHAPARTLESTHCRSTGLLHEITHLKDWTIYRQNLNTKDYARGVKACIALAATDSVDACFNADNYAYLAAGVYFGDGKRCGIQLPLS